MYIETIINSSAARPFLLTETKVIHKKIKDIKSFAFDMEILQNAGFTQDKILKIKKEIINKKKILNGYYLELAQRN